MSSLLTILLTRSVFASILANKTSQKVALTRTISFLTLLLKPVLYSFFLTVEGVEQNFTNRITNTKFRALVAPMHSFACISTKMLFGIFIVSIYNIIQS